MPANQQQDLFIEWDLYHPQEQETMITEFQRRFGGNYTKADLLEFLKKLKIEGCREKTRLIRAGMSLTTNVLHLMPVVELIFCEKSNISVSTTGDCKNGKKKTSTNYTDPSFF